MTYQLYYAPGACSMAIHAVLLECGQTATLHPVNLAAPRSPEFLKVNPRGSVPVLVADGHAIREGGAQIVYLCDTHQSPLIPASGVARAKALEWLMFANSTLHPAYGRLFFLRKTLGDAHMQSPAWQAGEAAIQTLWDELEAELASKPFLCGDAVTAGDILVSVIANWGAWLPNPPTFGPNLKAYFARVSARPAFQKALAAENVEYKAAA
jgi:glutathione S-transferase